MIPAGSAPTAHLAASAYLSAVLAQQQHLARVQRPTFWSRTKKTCFFRSRHKFHVRPNYSHRQYSRSNEYGLVLEQVPTERSAHPHGRVEVIARVGGWGYNPRMRPGSRSARHKMPARNRNMVCVMAREEASN